jgi:hypothetical protein
MLLVIFSEPLWLCGNNVFNFYHKKREQTVSLLPLMCPAV